MNVVYDISVFGAVEIYPSGRSGIYRYVENLARVLIDSGRCSIEFSAFEGYLHENTLKHLHASAEYRNAYLPRLSHSQAQYALTCRINRLNECIPASSGIKKAGLKSARKLSYLCRKLFAPDSGIETKLENADVFHSPYYAIPQRVRNYKKMKPFLSVMDLIPVLHPEFFPLPPDGSNHHLKTIVDGIKREDWVTCISQSTKDDLCNYRKDLDPRRVFVTHLGASKWFYPSTDSRAIAVVRTKLKIPAGRYVLSVCTLEPRKNLAHLIRCFARLVQQEQLPDLHLVLVGNLGWKYESIFAALTAAEGLRERIIITGYVADEDMAALYSNALFFVYPSLYEGFGLPLLEAMQCGVPVITSNTSSLPEVVDDAGIMVDPQDEDGLCAAMLQLASDGGLRAELARKSLEQAKRFSWTKCAEQTLNAYEAAVNLG